MGRILFSARNYRRRCMSIRRPTDIQEKTEAYALSYYFFTMFYGIPNRTVLGSQGNPLATFVSCVEALGKTNRLAAVLKREITMLEKQHLLTPLETTDAAVCFENSDVPYRYNQDSMIESELRLCGQPTETSVNLCRVLHFSPEPIFAGIINTTIFRNDEACALTQELSLSKQAEKAVFSIAKTQFLVDQVHLSEDEARYILFCYRLERTEALKILTNRYEKQEGGCNYNIAAMLGISEAELKRMLRSDQKLRTFDFIDSDGDYDNTLSECIAEQSIAPLFSTLLKPLDCSDAYNLESFSVDKKSVSVSLDLLNGKHPVSLLFYGKPGSGKTELAKSLCKLTGKTIYMFKNEVEADDKNIMGRLVCLLSMEDSDSILVVDEADNLLKTQDFSLFGIIPTKTKGTINKMLEENKRKVIYIINHKHQIDDSTLRRFTFSIKFEAMSAQTLRSIAQSKIAPLAISDATKEQVLDLLDTYKLTGASADNIVKVIEGMSGTDEKTLVEKVQTVMKENSLLLNGKAKIRETVGKEYDLSVVNASMNLEKIVTMVQNAQKFAEKNKGTESGIRMLFYGLSGTGKTEFARYIAQTLHKPLLLKRGSDIISKYVGGTEKNIKDAFEEAERTDAILLFDEADSFFQDRANATRSWEITQVNEFLTQMEAFSGILICTTNLRGIMDPAMQRRFHILSEFKALSKDGIKTLCQNYFPSLAFSDEQVTALERYKTVTPGDFASMFGRFRFMGESEQNADTIMRELESLQNEKMKNGNESHAIGFCA